MTTLHSVPFLFSVTNLALTDMVILKKDTKWVFLWGIQYMFANLLGTIEAGHPLYPIADWRNPTVTVILYTLNAAVMAGLYWVTCDLIQKYRHYKEE